MKKTISAILTAAAIVLTTATSVFAKDTGLAVKPHKYKTNADYEYTYDINSNSYTKKVDTGIELTFDECYGVIKMQGKNMIDDERAGIDDIIEVPIVRENSKITIRFTKNNKYSNLDQYSNLYMGARHFNHYDYGTTNVWNGTNFNEKTCFHYNTAGSLYDSDKGSKFNIVSNTEMWYKAENGLNDYTFSYSEDAAEYLTLKFVLAVNDKQLEEIKNKNTYTYKGVGAFEPSGEWTYTFPGLYELLFEGQEPETEETVPAEIEFYKKMKYYDTGYTYLFRLKNDSDVTAKGTYIMIPYKNCYDYDNKKWVYNVPDGYAVVSYDISPHSEKIYNMNVYSSHGGVTVNEGNLKIEKGTFQTEENDVNLQCLFCRIDDDDNLSDVLRELESNKIRDGREMKKDVGNDNAAIKGYDSMEDVYAASEYISQYID